jgi:hypothetical protein
VQLLDAVDVGSDASVRMAAAEALGEIGPPAKSAVEALLRAYGAQDYLLRMTAQRALIKIAGPESIPSTPPPGGIELLSGWSHRQEQGIDTLVGTIWRADGLKIGYDIGFLAGHHASNTDRPLLWTKKQIVHGYPVQITLRPNRFLEILFFDDSANFSAQVKTEQDVTEVLLITLSYNPSLISSDLGGVYSNVTESSQSVDLEIEVRLGVRQGGYYAMVHSWGPGAPNLPSVVPVEFVAERIVFTVVVDGKPQHFSGDLKPTELVGTLGDRPVVLRKRGGRNR